MRLRIATALLAASLFWPERSAHAQLSSSAIEVAAFPILGPGTPVVDGWFSCVVQVTNNGDAAASGTVELVNERAWVRDNRHTVTQAPFSVPARGKVSLELPTRGFHGVPPSLMVRALDEGGTPIREHNLPDLHPLEPLLFDLDVPSRSRRHFAASLLPHRRPRTCATGLRNWSSAIRRSIPSGHPILPGLPRVTRAWRSCFRAATRWPNRRSELEALGNWVLAGGALAVVVTRPEDLRGGFLKTLVGSEIAKGAPPTALTAPTPFPVPQQTPGSGSLGPTPHSGAC